MTVGGVRHREAALLRAAQGGDEHAFRRLVEPRRTELHAHCYRMLGSVHDAEDVLQETKLRAWRGLARFTGEPSRLRPWLYRIATNACLDALARRPQRRLAIEMAPDESDARVRADAWIEPYPDGELGLEEGHASPDARYEQRESIELAFIAALHHLSPKQRAVLILRDALGFSAREVAEMLDTSTASVNSALQRARRAVDAERPQRSQQATLRSLGDGRVREIVRRFIDAFERGDVEAILATLTEDAAFAMPPYRGVYRGRDAIGESWLMPGGPPPRLRYVPTRANGQVAVGAYQLDAGGERYVPIALDVLTLRDDGIAEVVAFRMPELFGAFGLPDEVPA